MNMLLLPGNGSRHEFEGTLLDHQSI